MKNLLLQIETKIQEIIEEKSLAVFGLGETNNILIEEILNSMKSNLKITENGRVHSPNLFAIHFPKRFSDEIKSNLSFSKKLTDSIHAAGESLGIHFEYPIEINIYSNEQIAEGEFKIFSSFLSNHQVETKKMIGSTSVTDKNYRSEAYLIVNGVDIFPIDKAVINLGRKNTNELMIKDGRVSRKHAQIRNIDGIFILSDLGSTGGTFVNDLKIEQVTLHPGDVISLAGVMLVFGNEAVYSLEDTKEFLIKNKNSGKEKPLE